MAMKHAYKMRLAIVVSIFWTSLKTKPFVSSKSLQATEWIWIEITL